MNQDHLNVCASAEWGAFLAETVFPAVLADVDLGPDVIEIGSGPGLSTDLLRERSARLTAVELDDALAASLTARLAGTNVTVVQADATDLPLPGDSFSGGVSFTMLHHVPTPALQDRIFAELARVVVPGGTVVLNDSLGSDALRDFHHDDVYNPIDPSTLERRLSRAGFADASITVNEFAFWVHARV
ncbi:MAG: class I SAM-dependent methyltransferase [Acidimicrobiia bacterium]